MAICVREPATLKEDKKTRPLLSSKVFHSKDRDTYGQVRSFLEVPLNSSLQQKQFESDNEANPRESSNTHDFVFSERVPQQRNDIYSFY